MLKGRSGHYIEASCKIFYSLRSNKLSKHCGAFEKAQGRAVVLSLVATPPTSSNNSSHYTKRRTLVSGGGFHAQREGGQEVDTSFHPAQALRSS